MSALKELGWEVLVLWECDLRSSDWIDNLLRFLDPQTGK